MSLVNGYYSVVLDFPFNTYIDKGPQYLIGEQSDGGINLSKDINSAIKLLENTISEQKHLYKAIEAYYNKKFSGKTSFSEFLKNYSSLGDVTKVANLSANKTKKHQKKIIPPNIDKYLHTFQQQNWESVNIALDLHFRKKSIAANELEEWVSKNNTKIARQTQQNLKSVKNILMNLQKLEQENQTFYSQIRESWLGEEKIIFGREKDASGNLAEYKELSQLIITVQEKIDALQQQEREIFNKNSKNTVFTKQGQKIVREEIQTIVDSWFANSKYKDMQLTSKEGNMIRKRAADFILLTLANTNSYEGITFDKLNSPIVIAKKRNRKTARGSVQEISPFFNLDKTIDDEDMRNSIIIGHSGDIKFRPIKRIVTSTLQIDSNDQEQQEQLKQLYGIYKKTTDGITKTFEEFQKNLQQLKTTIEYEQDKVDDYLILGDNITNEDTSGAQYAIAFSDKLYSDYGVFGEGLTHIGLEDGNLMTNLEQLQSSSFNKILNEKIIFTLLNSSSASAYHSYITAISSYIEKIFNAYIYEITFNPTNFVQFLKTQYDINLTGKVLYVYKVGGFNIPLFEALQQILNNFSTLNQNKQLIQLAITPDSSNAFQLYANARASNPNNKVEQWNYVAHQVANNTNIAITMNLRQISGMFMS